MAFVCLVFWFFGGPNMGRTTFDSAFNSSSAEGDAAASHVTMIPGVDFLAAGFVLGGILWGCSRLIKSPALPEEAPEA